MEPSDWKKTRSGERNVRRPVRNNSHLINLSICAPPSESSKTSFIHVIRSVTNKSCSPVIHHAFYTLAAGHKYRVTALPQLWAVLRLRVSFQQYSKQNFKLNSRRSSCLAKNQESPALWVSSPIQTHFLYFPHSHLADSSSSQFPWLSS